MLQIQREILESLLLCLAALKKAERERRENPLRLGESIRDEAASWAYDQAPHNHPLQDWIINQHNEGGLNPVDLENLCQETVALALQKEGDNASVRGALIDSILEILQRPYSRNSFNSAHLDLLKRAILFPQESKEIAQKVLEVERVCCQCFTPLSNEELVTFRFATDGMGNPSAMIYCYRCRKPTVIACETKGCKDKMKLPEHLLRKTPVCANHNNKPIGEKLEEVNKPAGELDIEALNAPPQAGYRMLLRDLDLNNPAPAANEGHINWTPPLPIRRRDR